MKYIGKTINNWKVIRKLREKSSDNHALYECECVLCGFKQISVMSTITRSNITDCKNHMKITNSKWKSRRLRRIFNGMMQRCYNPNDKDYGHYGARFIMICSEWRHNHKSFEDWAYANGYNDNFTIDRINPKLGYYPANCRWISLENNARWKSTTKVISVNGITDTGKGWARRLSLGINHINRYLRKNGYESTVKYIKTFL